jgi:hypothetical protein
MSHFVSFTDDAKGDIARLKRSEPQAYKKRNLLFIHVQDPVSFLVGLHVSIVLFI